MYFFYSSFAIVVVENFSSIRFKIDKNEAPPPVSFSFRNQLLSFFPAPLNFPIKSHHFTLKSSKNYTSLVEFFAGTGVLDLCCGGSRGVLKKQKLNGRTGLGVGICSVKKPSERIRFLQHVSTTLLSTFLIVFFVFCFCFLRSLLRGIRIRRGF